MTKSGDVVLIEYSASRKRRAVVLRRGDNTYSVAEEYWYETKYDNESLDQGWARLPTDSIYATLEDAKPYAEDLAKLLNKKPDF